MAHKRPESVLVLVYTLAGEVLVLQRRQPPDFWQSVTGSLEWSEPPEAAARRELEEETGIQAGSELLDCRVVNEYPILPAWRSRYAPEVRTNREFVFRLQCHSRLAVRIDPREHRSYQWLPREAAAGRVSSHTNRTAILRFVFGS
jgi:dATP pyrophosphohydrolase